MQDWHTWHVVMPQMRALASVLSILAIYHTYGLIVVQNILLKLINTCFELIFATGGV